MVFIVSLDIRRDNSETIIQFFSIVSNQIVDDIRNTISFYKMLFFCPMTSIDGASRVFSKSLIMVLMTPSSLSSGNLFTSIFCKASLYVVDL